MKKIDLRNFVLSNNKQKAWYRGVEIIACGLMGEPNRYWIDLADGTTYRGLTRIEVVEVIYSN